MTEWKRWRWIRANALQFGDLTARAGQTGGPAESAARAELRLVSPEFARQRQQPVPRCGHGYLGCELILRIDWHSITERGKKIMEYKTRGFEPSVAGGNTDSVAAALQSLIAAEAVDGWEFVALENHSTVVPGNAGCFGIGASSPYPKTFSIAVFRK